MIYEKTPSTYHHEPVEYWVKGDQWWEVETDFGDGAVELRECTAEIFGKPRGKVQLYAFASDRAHLDEDGWSEVEPETASVSAEKARGMRGLPKRRGKQ